MEEKMKAELDKCKSVKEMISVVDKYYDLNQPLGTFFAATAKATIPKIPVLLNLKKR